MRRNASIQSATFIFIPATRKIPIPPWRTLALYSRNTRARDSSHLDDTSSRVAQILATISTYSSRVRFGHDSMKFEENEVFIAVLSRSSRSFDTRSVWKTFVTKHEFKNVFLNEHPTDRDRGGRYRKTGKLIESYGYQWRRLDSLSAKPLPF